MRQKSYSKFKKWEKFCINNNLEIIFDNYPEQINPWCYPVYVNNQNEQIKWFNWAWKNNVDLFSWPLTY